MEDETQHPQQPDHTPETVRRDVRSAPLAPAPAEVDAATSGVRFLNLPPKADGFPSVDDLQRHCLRLPDNWRALGVSSRGRSHQHRASFREDALDMRGGPGGWIVAAIADGGGSYKLSRLGSTAATQAAVTSIHQEMRAQPHLFTSDMAPTSGRLSSLLTRGTLSAQQSIEQLATNYQRPLSDFNTTLLLVLHGHYSDGRQIAATMQVGDGVICAFVRNPDNAEKAGYMSLALSDDGAIGGHTLFLSSISPADIDDRVRVFDLPAATEAIILATDGISDDFKPLEQRFWRMMRALRLTVFPEEDGAAVAALEQLISYEDRPDSFDDRTIFTIHAPVAIAAKDTASHAI